MRIRVLKSLAFAILAFNAARLSSAQADGLEGLGVAYHIRPESIGEDLKKISDTGFTTIRTDIFWEDTERTKGQYDWSLYDRLVVECKKNRLFAILILDYSNPLYEAIGSGTKGRVARPLAPRSAASRNAYIRWAAAAAKRYSDAPVTWEIWNEPNLDTFWRPGPDALEYSSLATRTCDAIRSVSPGATVIAPGVAGLDWAFLERVFQSGLLECINGVSIHPYRRTAPESISADISTLKDVIKKYSSRNIHVYITEIGYPNHLAGFSEETQANYLIRTYLMALQEGVAVIWYNWRDKGKNRLEREHTFGVVDYSGSPKLSYFAVRDLSEALAGYRYIRSLSESGSALLFENDRKQKKLIAFKGRFLLSEYQESVSSNAEHNGRRARHLKTWQPGEKPEIYSLPITAEDFTLYEFPPFSK